MVQALICAQDWLRPNTRIDVNDYFDELRDLEKGNAQLCNCCPYSVNQFIYFILRLKT